MGVPPMRKPPARARRPCQVERQRPPVSDLPQTILIALAVGSLYALIALGYTMVYGILKLINFAHGDVVVLGAWLSYTIAVWLLRVTGLGVDHPPWWVGPIVLV